MAFDPSVWGPHYWFFLHSMAMNYPHFPNSITKKKYYDFIQNFHLFIPVQDIANNFSCLIENYPVAPYLDNRESFVRWMHFIHNKINEKLEKPKITLGEFYAKFYEAYKPKETKIKNYQKLKRYLIYLGLLLLIGGAIYYLYDK
jgi:FAD-linked sulfhydryl oxidase